MARVLILIKGLGRGGAERLLATAAPFLDRDHFDYEVAYLLPWKNALVPELEAAGVQTRCLDGGTGTGWVRRLRAAVESDDVRVVHAHSPYPAAVARMALRRRVGIVYTEHNVWARYRRPTYWANLLTFGRNDHVFTVSDDVRTSIRYPRAVGFLRMPPMETLYHGLDPTMSWASSEGVREELGIPPSVLLVGTVGSLTPKKDHANLLRALAHMGDRRDALRAILVGHGPLEEALRHQAEELGLSRTVLFAGHREDATRIVGALDVFVLPSRYEGLPVSLLEAMALGRPVVATTAGGIPEVVRDGEEGVLVPTDDPRALARALTDLIEDPERRARLGDAARRRAADFDIRNAVRRQETVYRELVG
jgi:glycosyltransferase involved in cell wall biosynthesis